jgi:hypothetical protein
VRPCHMHRNILQALPVKTSRKNNFGSESFDEGKSVNNMVSKD